jgi:LysM repeat protein
LKRFLEKKQTGVINMAQSNNPCSSGRYWRVAGGDTLYSIAVRVGTSVDELLNLNPGVDAFSLQIGQSICLPAQLPPCPSGVYWVVAPGDTLYAISQATGSSVDALFAANPGIDPGNLQVGQKICLP